MHQSVAKLSVAPDHVLIDGNRSPWGHPEATRANGTVRYGKKKKHMLVHLHARLYYLTVQMPDGLSIEINFGILVF